MDFGDLGPLTRGVINMRLSYVETDKHRMKEIH